MSEQPRGLSPRTVRAPQPFRALALLDAARDPVPVCARLGYAVRDEIFLTTPHDDEHLDRRRVTRERPPRRGCRAGRSCPCSSSRDERTHDREAGARGGVVRHRHPRRRSRARRRRSAGRARCARRRLRARARSAAARRRRAQARSRGCRRARPARATPATSRPATESLHEHRAQAVDQLSELDVLVALLGQHLVHGGDREDPVDGVLERLARIDVVGARLQPQGATPRSAGCS